MKVIRFDNNKVQTHVKSLQLTNSSEVTYANGALHVPHQHTLQLFNIEERSLQTLDVKAKNHVVGARPSPATNVKAHCLTPDQKTLVTFEELADTNSHKDIKVQTLKFWHRESMEQDLSSFEVQWLLHNPYSSD